MCDEDIHIRSSDGYHSGFSSVEVLHDRDQDRNSLTTIVLCCRHLNRFVIKFTTYPIC